MSDFKSKLPDFKEVTSMATKFYKDMKTSVCEIIKDYKEKHPQTVETASTEEPVVKTKPAASEEEIIVVKEKEAEIKPKSTQSKTAPKPPESEL